MAKKFSTLRAQMPCRARIASDREYAKLRAELPLHQLRLALKLSQQQIAAEMGVSQAAISHLEHREDLLVSTLRRFVEAMGGELELRARFPAGEVTLSDLGAEGGAPHGRAGSDEVDHVACAREAP